MTAVIPLAKGYDPSKLNFPVLLSQKYDGVPVLIEVYENEGVPSLKVNSRQGKHLPSVYWMIHGWVLSSGVLDNVDLPVQFVGEIVQKDPFADFKETSGKARKQEAQHDLYIKLFDMDTYDGAGYKKRYNRLKAACFYQSHVTVVSSKEVKNQQELEHVLETFLDTYPKAEGMIARSHDDKFEAGKRSWGYQKLLVEPTIDLRIVYVEEAVDGKTGEGKGMVGRLVASYHGEKIGIGPGKLTHKERISLWQDWNKALTSNFARGGMQDALGIAQIKYKKDDSYDALRQPTFQYWRPEKTEPDA